MAPSDEIFGLYHLWTVNTWHEIATEQLARLTSSGLVASTSRIFASVAGPDADAGRALLEAALGPRLALVRCSDDASSSERPILEHARKLCGGELTDARAIWYLHAKGVSSYRCRNPGVVDWRRYLEYFVVERWADSAAAIGAFDLSGANWCVDPTPHFSGNFWWASPRYLATLPERIGPGYLEPEFWVAANKPRVRSFHDSEVNHYAERYPASAYRDDGRTDPPDCPSVAGEVTPATDVFVHTQRARAAGDHRGALDWYSKRIGLGGWEEEVFSARLQRARLLELLDEPGEQVVAAYIEAWQSRPTRAEPLHDLARRCRLAGVPDLGYLFARRAAALPFPAEDVLHVEADVYEWRAAEELSRCAYELGRYREAAEIAGGLLEQPALPEPFRERILAHRLRCSELIT